MPIVNRGMRRLGAAAAAAAVVAAGFGFGATGAGADESPSSTTMPTSTTEAPPTTTPPPAPCALQAPGNARYVAWVYQKVLYRCPDASGLAYWTAKLNSGMSRFSFVVTIDNSDENIMGNNVAALYQGVLHRAPTQAEAAHWANKIRTERADGELFATLYASDAFWNSPAVKHDTDTFIAFLYKAVLDRVGDQSVADPQGFSFFRDILGPTPTEAQRFHVAFRYFEQSTENAHDWVWASYQSGLGRQADPTGGTFWTDWVLDHGFRTFDMCNALEASQEAYNNAQTQQNPPPEPAH